ncbi:MAG: hypothetical protein PWQ59_1940 [Thermoanaerobacterium sp.]|nr:hypothetical protein [Thermoanaerobacterium sp.]MDN5346209.1 hypothetical protein [Petrotoga sp.]
MSLKALNFKKIYSSDYDNILEDFYIPALKETTEYCRLAGFFSSKSLAIAARGIVGLVRNNGHMKMVVCPKLTDEDLNTIIKAKDAPEKYAISSMLKELDDLTEGFIRDHVYALGWMIANDKLDIKIALVYNESGKYLNEKEILSSGVFHQKVGIMKDEEGNVISFSGSVNESASGWLRNIEEFKVFRSWIPGENEYVASDVANFNRFWMNESPRARVVEIPEAVRDKLIKMAPKDIDDVELEKWYFQKSKKQKTKVKLYQYQKDAVLSWIKNGKCGIFEMATGTGKTYTALACVDRVFSEIDKVLLIIACPYQHLTSQWKKEIDNFGIEYNRIIEAYSGKKWKDCLANFLMDLSMQHISSMRKVVVLTTHRTLCSEDFIKIIRSYKNNFKIFLVSDEVHGMGAAKAKQGLINEYDFRLGLSATPKRWFDDDGTNALYNYFGNVVFEFGLKEAIEKINPATGKTYLAPYNYKPVFVTLNNDELYEYIKKTSSIIKRYNRSDKQNVKDELLESLLFTRAKIIKNASAKYDGLENVLNELAAGTRHIIVYCTSEQIDRVMQILNQRCFIAHRFTMKEGTTPSYQYGGVSEREYVLKEFAEGKYQVLVAMKCLDEGVDVPSARTAILMASSGNPREYVQRIGRVIRRAPDKKEATIYDLIAAPSLNEELPLELRNIEIKIFEKEINRYVEIAQNAKNKGEAFELLYETYKEVLGI